MSSKPLLTILAALSGLGLFLGLIDAGAHNTLGPSLIESSAILLGAIIIADAIKKRP